MKRIALWFLAAIITLAVLFVAVLIYQWTVYEPEPPTVANCQSIETSVTADSAAQLYVYQCKRGTNPSWEGYEVWAQKVVNQVWQRLATSPKAAGCVGIRLEDRRVVILHEASRGDLSVAASSFVYELAEGGATTLSVATERVNDCRRDSSKD
ncbi:hypothetical protein [Pseudidiomarina homiensis]|uniref:hypothetical protein n=1 Tax=Pseudidiomarina homiensis TaxID=364198 RepID=UPI00215B3DAE|nr:hypothetical protein [Pseudidiomarina homiensis]